MKLFSWARKKSPWIFHLNTGSCNNCDIELVDALTPRFDVERLGVLLEGSIRHSDILVVSGVVNRQNGLRLRRIYEQMPDKKYVVAIGACAISCDVFEGSYNVVGPVDKYIPVDVYVPGCPPRPQAIIDGIAEAVKKMT